MDRLQADIKMLSPEDQAKVKAILRIEEILMRQTVGYCLDFAAELERRYPPPQPSLRLAE